MSRCFPFPPPGYEKKPRSDQEDLLIKEKHKEKKHRKEKRDKEKREGKERKDRDKDKDHSKDKHREKKDKKDKHRDKDKKKHKDRDKDKKKILHESKGEEHTEAHNEGNLGERSCEAEYLNGLKFTEELGRRIRDEESRAGNQMGEKITGKVQRAFEGMGSSTEKKSTCNKMVTGNKIIQSITIPDQRMGMASTTEARGTEDEMLQNSICEQRRVNGTGRPMGQDARKNIEGKERTKEQEVDGRKDRVREKVHKEKNKERGKEKKKEKTKTREKGERKHKEQDKLRDIQKKEQEDSPNVRSSLTPKDNQRSACAEGSLKRKQINGFLHENEMRCNKLSRPASSSKLSLENGRKLDQNLIGSPCASDNHEAVNLVKVETIVHKDSKVNGIIDIQPPAILGPTFISDATGSSESLKKPPHPDEKYLSQILHVPKMEWPEFDDQEWLLTRENIRQRPKTAHNADESLRVWSSALQIETADVLALPYVIPF